MGATIDITELELFRKDFCLLSDFFDFVCGKYIGSGNTRYVYDFRLDPKFVIKVEQSKDGAHSFDNVSEWEMWHNMRHHNKKIAEFLCPVHNISKCGKILTMWKTTPITDKKLLPKNIPGIFTDLKLQNWGMLKGKVVCHDYANHLAFRNAASLPMIKANWWSENYQKIFE